MIGAAADTNIYISGLNFGGVPRQFLAAARRGRFRLDVSPAILAELAEILRGKFEWTSAMVERGLALLARTSTLVHPTESVSVVAVDPDDDRILECAVAASSRYLVTGDKHLVRLGSYGAIRIVRVSEFLSLLPASRCILELLTGPGCGVGLRSEFEGIRCSVPRTQMDVAEIRAFPSLSNVIIINLN